MEDQHSFLAILVVIVVVTTSSIEPVAAGADYSMYVWTNSFDSTVSGCDETKFNNWDTSDTTCFTHSWNSATKPAWLWNTCKVSGREVITIYLSGVHTELAAAETAQSCSVTGIDLIKQTLAGMIVSRHVIY